MSDVTRILTAIDHGDPKAAEELLPIVYQELRHLASRKLSREQPGQTLQTTALVHEAWLRLAGSGAPKKWNGPAHFYAAAAEAMRRILIENARRKKAQKRGANLQRVDFDKVELAVAEPPDEVLALDDALKRLAEKDPVKGELVKLRFFAGLTTEQAAEVLGVSVATADRYWVYARAWLYQAIYGDEKSGAGNPRRRRAS
jgi:RNA polymerase sigma factor (TIGR02999 family)